MAYASILAVSLLAGCNDQSQSTTAAAPAAVPQSAESGSATLSWEVPTTNTNGTPLTDLAGYRIYYGSSATDLDQSVQLPTVGLQTYVIDDLQTGTWYFAIMAVTNAGTESALSNIVSKTIGS
jgi:hypothetical protein